MSAIRTVNAQELKQMLNVKMLVPDIQTFEKVLKISRDNQVELDSSALKSIGSMYNTLASTTMQSYSTIQDTYNRVSREGDEISADRLSKVWAQIMNLSEVSQKARDRLSVNAQRYAHESNMKDKENNASFGKMALGILGGVAAIFAAGHAVKTARKPTMLEHFTGKK